MRDDLLEAQRQSFNEIIIAGDVVDLLIPLYRVPNRVGRQILGGRSSVHLARIGNERGRPTHRASTVLG
jgi:hypothetical protein